MNKAVPTGVEASLLDVGFSSTEVMIIRRLLEDDMHTLRGLASATGKSTGVLDQATKKLVLKNIIHKETINDTDKFTITSLEAVLHWMEDDAKRKQELLARRQQTFESFIRSFEHQKHRPEIEYFDGLDGLAKAYRKILGCGKELLGYVPVFCSIEDHPLRDFMVEWFRQRRTKGIFSRIITHNTPLGRRFQSRDPFEYRQSMLVEEDQLPFTFEKYICGNSVLCFNYAEKRACMLKYPEMASMETSMFESWWKRLHNEKKSSDEAAKSIVTGDETKEGILAQLVPPPPVVTPVPFSVRTFSGLREFFLSKKSIAAFAGIALLAAGLTFYLYTYAKDLEFRHMQDTVKSIAAAGAFQFDARDLDALQVAEDWKKPEWRKVVRQLEKIRKTNADLLYVYIIRKSKDDPTKIEFVSDSHSLNPYVNRDSDPNNNIDLDGNGIIEPDTGDYLAWPGQSYPPPAKETFLAYIGPIANDQFYEDQWGKVITGYAPIKDSEGRVAGILGIDMNANLLAERTTNVFSPVMYFIGFFLFFVLVRLAAFNRSLFEELWNGLRIKNFLLIISVCGFLSLITTFGFYKFNLYLTEKGIQDKILLVATTGALQFDTNDLDQLHTPDDIHKLVYAKVIQHLNDIRSQNVGLKYAYIMRTTADPKYYEFVADADSLDPYAKLDLNGDGIIDEKDLLSPPGQQYLLEKNHNWSRAMQEPVVYSDVDTQWGNLISAWAPIKDAKGKSVAVLGIDKFSSDLPVSSRQFFSPTVWFFGFLLVYLAIILGVLAVIHRSFTKQIWDFFQLRKVLVALTLSAELAYGITFGMYHYMLRQTIDKNGGELMSIVTTAGPEFRVADLDQLHWAKDMKKDAYQNVFKKLNEIKKANPEITYIYIFRAVNPPQIFEWVADTYSNYYLPAIGPDVNADGQLDNADTNIAPGMRLWIAGSGDAANIALKKPTYEKDFYTDQWGTWISGYAPIKDSAGVTHGILGADFEASKIQEDLRSRFSVWFWFTGVLCIALFLVWVKKIL